MAGDPLRHIIQPNLPWRTDEARTECGRAPSDTGATWTRAEVETQATKLGTTRLHMVACITCLQTADRWWGSTWEENPASVLGRYIEKSTWRKDDAYVIGLDSAPSLTERRQDRRLRESFS